MEPKYIEKPIVLTRERDGIDFVGTYVLKVEPFGHTVVKMCVSFKKKKE